MSIDEVELLNFFGVEPQRLDPGVPWPYNDFAYELTRGGLSLTFALAPAYKDVRICLKQNGLTLYELHALNVKAVRVLHEKQGEVLEIAIADGNVLWLRAQPELSVVHRAGE